MVGQTINFTAHPRRSWDYILENPANGKTAMREGKTLWEKWG
jgi:hypothetical protein